MRDWLSFSLSVVCFVSWSIYMWAWAHGTVATECEKLGAFYVGNKVYECKVKGREQ